MPSDSLPGWAAPDKPAPFTPSSPVPAVPAAETRSAAAMPDQTEPSPVLPVEKSPRPKPRPVSVEAERDEAEPADPALVLALVALILVGVAVVGSQFPHGRFIAIGVAGIGFLGGLAALGGEGRARLYGGVALGLHTVILIVVLLVPSWLSLEPWRGPAVEEPKGPQAVEHGTGLTRTYSPGDWLDGATQSWQFQDVRVSVRSAAVGPVELVGPKGVKRTTKEPYLQLVLRVVNTGAEREVPLSGWATGQADALQITDAAGKPLKPAAFDEGWAPELRKPPERLMPGHSPEVRFLFVAPPPKNDSLRIKLSGAAFGMPDQEIQFRIGGGLFARPVGP